MIATMIAMAVAIAIGIPIALAIDRRARGSALLGEAALLGLAMLAADLAILSLFAIPWTRSSVSIAAALTVAPFIGFAVRRRHSLHPVLPRDGSRAITLVAVAIVAVTVIGYGVFATIAPTIEYDFIGIWGVKAKVFLLARHIDFTFLQHPWNSFTHPDYPILLPLAFDVVGVFKGAFEDRWIGLLYPFFGLATLSYVFRSFRSDLRRIDAAAIATVAVISSALSPWIGLAEGPLVAYGTIGLLLVRRGLGEEGRSSILAGAVFLGLAASCKNEGLSLIVAAAIAIVLLGRSRWRAVVALWPAALIAAPWLLARAVHDLPTDLATGSLATRIAAHLENVGEIVSSLIRYSGGRPFFWGGIVLAIIVFMPEAWRRERFLLLTILVQCAFFVGAYVATPHDIGWHVRWSWERIVMQLALPSTYLAIVLCARQFAPASEAQHESAIVSV